MRRKYTFAVAAFLVLLSFCGALWGWQWKQEEPRRNCFAVLQRLDATLRSSNASSLLDHIVPPQAIQGRTAVEQLEFIGKALRDEISAEGLAVIKKEGRFGPLRELFPTEGDAWAAQAGVKPDDCLAFKLERNGLRAEVVLLAQTSNFKIVRCNNVKQLAKL